MLDSARDRRRFFQLALTFLFILMAYEMLAEQYLLLELWQQVLALGFVGVIVWRLQKRRK